MTRIRFASCLVRLADGAREDHMGDLTREQIIEAYKSPNAETLSATLADDVVWHEAGNPETITGRDAVLQRMGGMTQSAMPEIDVHDILLSDSHMVAMLNVTIRRGDGAEVSYPVVEIAHIDDGKITERWSFMDACPEYVTKFFAG
jgi:ketosteroid isomerase-like protein